MGRRRRFFVFLFFFLILFLFLFGFDGGGCSARASTPSTVYFFFFFFHLVVLLHMLHKRDVNGFPFTLHSLPVRLNPTNNKRPINGKILSSFFSLLLISSRPVCLGLHHCLVSKKPRDVTSFLYSSLLRAAIIILAASSPSLLPFSLYLFSRTYHQHHYYTTLTWLDFLRTPKTVMTTTTKLAFPESSYVLIGTFDFRQLSDPQVSFSSPPSPLSLPPLSLYFPT